MLAKYKVILSWPTLIKANFKITMEEIKILEEQMKELVTVFTENMKELEN